ncbi:MAG TPA: tRNA uridine-5-carboxymethylaminomethyl(34) synthesis GTPase MnmE [Steroidobacteraceae bacterium]|nr:tRNA uridine-5-carboxymethylaminomethyl(34) synthesis GTPase MnmE [Steroidobacteraceae bacterium]
MTDAGDTIVAAATPPGRGGIGIVRISGPGARAMARAMLGRLPRARVATRKTFAGADGAAIDSGIALWFPKPRSFTGEDVLELHGHGGPVVMDMLIARAMALGARMARPGEFSQRAFMNDKLDLAQAEAIADLIDAGSAEAARAAARSLAGEFSREVQALAAAVLELRTFVEAAIDFPDEDVEFLQSPEVAARLGDIAQRFERIGAAAATGRALTEGLTVVIAGRPNAGKSSLLNALAGHDAAIVTGIPGTTRDVLRERIAVDGLPIHVADTAGLRESPDAIEAEGMRRARAEMARADLLLYVVDAAAGAAPGELESLPPGPPAMVVWNKTDLVPVPAGASGIGVSALTGAGLDALRGKLKAAAGYREAGAGAYSARRRHLDALARAKSLFEVAGARLAQRASFELVAEDLRQAHRALGEITGEVTSDELLGAIFAGFCIGK